MSSARAGSLNPALPGQVFDEPREEATRLLLSEVHAA